MSANPARNGTRDRGDRCGNSVLTKFSRSRCSPGEALYAPTRSHPGPLASCSSRGMPHSPQYSPAGTSVLQTRHSTMPGVGSSVSGSVLMARLPLATVLARASLRSSLAIVFAGSWVDPLQCEQVTGEVVDVGSAEPANQVIAGACGVDGIPAEGH